MRVIIKSDTNAASRCACDLLAAAVRCNPRIVLGLATGSSPVLLYRGLTELYQAGQIDFQDVLTFNLDEYVGLASTDVNSYRTFMRKHLFDHVNLAPQNTHLPDGEAADLTVECLEYEERIRLAGGIDLQLLGIGRNGHIGFNEPGSSLASRTRVVALARVTREDNARFFGSVDAVPQLAITMGVQTILDARQIVLIATGANKADIVRQAIEGPITATVPASALQLHPDTTVFLDEAAASQLQNRAYYDDCEAVSRATGPCSVRSMFEKA